MPFAATHNPSSNGGRSTVPRVSVVLPTHNRRGLLPRAMKSALAQEGVEIELLVIDDGSTDGTHDYLSSIRDPRVRPLRQEPNQGVAHARNLGIAEATAPWLAFLDDDDFWAPFRLRTLVGFAEAEGAGWAYSAVTWVDAEGGVLWTIGGQPTSELRADLVDVNVVGTPSTVIARTDLVRAVGAFDPRLSVLADWDLWLRLSDAAPAAACPESLVAYVEHDGSMQLEQLAQIPAELRLMEDKHREISAAAGRRLGGRVYRRWIARTHHRAGNRLHAAALFLGVGVRYRSPRDVQIGIGILAGERAMAIARRVLRRPAVIPTPRSAPLWLKEQFEDPIAEPVRWHPSSAPVL